jgi:hypothetical protein
MLLLRIALKFDIFTFKFVLMIEIKIFGLNPFINKYS